MRAAADYYFGVYFLENRLQWTSARALRASKLHGENGVEDCVARLTCCLLRGF
jgi:hypothetical protein